MNKSFKILTLSLIAFNLLVLISCSPEEITTPTPPTSFEEDPLYGTLNNDSTMEDYINVFIQDALRHGVDYTSVIKTISPQFDPSPMLTRGIADGWVTTGCDPTKIGFTILKETWDSLNFDGTFKDGRESKPSVYFTYDQNAKYHLHIPYYKLKLVYHELGHDLLGLGHTCAPGHIMTDNDPSFVGYCGRLYEEGIGEEYYGDINGGLFNMATLVYQHEEELRDWNRAVDDLFSQKEQYFLECRTSFFD